MKYFLITITILLSASFVCGQISLQHDHGELILTEIYSPDSIIYFDAPVSPKDIPSVVLFKQYFNPGTLASYRKFFLSKDWFDATQDQFDAWQTKIKSMRLRLSHILHLKTPAGDAYLIIQYEMEDDTYIIPASSEFKWIQNVWMHTSLQNDALGPVLSRIGDYDPQYYKTSLKSRSVNSIQLGEDNLLPVWQVKEKFDRDTIFDLLIPVLARYKMTTDIIEVQRNIFRQKDDRYYIEQLNREFQIDEIEFMEAANDVIGFRLFNYSQAQKN